MPLYRGETIAPATAVELGTTQINQIWYGTNLVHPTDVGDPPGPVTGLTYNASTTSVFVDWTAPADTATTDPATQYRIEFGEDTNYGEPAIIVSEPATSHTITGLTANTTYHIRVRAENLGGVSEWEDIQVYTSTTIVVNAPELEYAAGTNYIDLTWDHPSEGNRPTSYLIQWRPSTSTSYTGQNNPTPADGTSFRISSLTPDTTYFVRIRASIGSTQTFSDEEEIRTMASAAVAPGPVRGLSSTYTFSSSNRIRVSWTAPNSGGTPTTYRIQWNEFGTSESNFAAGSELSSFTLAILISARGGYNRTNYIRVRAENTHGNGPWRNIERVTTVPTLNPPTNLSVSAAGATLIDVSWSAPSGGADEYRVSWGTSTGYGSSTIVSGTSTQITGLTAGTLYYVGVRSEHSITSFGSSSNATGSVTTYALNPPRNFDALREGGGARLSWSLPSGNNQVSYDIERYDSSVAEVWVSVVGNLPSNSVGWDIDLLGVGHWTFRIRANYNNNVSSAWVETPNEIRISFG